MLPVVATDDSWKPLAGGFVEDTLVPYLSQSLRPYWETAQQDVATVMNRPIDEALPEILGTDAILRGLRSAPGSPRTSIGETASAQILPDLGPQGAAAAGPPSPQPALWAWATTRWIPPTTTG